MKSTLYDRKSAVEYAQKWAFDRNNKYFNFDKLGGDCTNFISQCIFAGSSVMNYTPTYGWYYNNANNRTPSWTGVNFLYNFLINNKKEGPYGIEVSREEVEEGDVIQLAFNDGAVYNHSLLVVKKYMDKKESIINISTHTYDRFDYSLSNYQWKKIRYIHILGVRK